MTNYLGFQRCSDGTVRALRFNNNHELLSTRAIGDLSTAVAAVDSFKRDNPQGVVQVEDPKTSEVANLGKGAQLVALFDDAKTKSANAPIAKGAQ
jgi:hypothetical protein